MTTSHMTKRPAPVLFSPEQHRTAQGALMPIGGAEDRSEETPLDILRRFVELSGGKRAKILIVPTASESPEGSVKTYQHIFDDIGVDSTESLQVKRREDASSDEVDAQVRRSTGVFITGGDQARLVALLVGTRFMQTLRERNGLGLVVGGTSAGASILCHHTIVGGTGVAGSSGDGPPRKASVDIVSGLGLMADVIIDQHFNQRGRIGRLLSVFAGNPGLLAIGLDENTAAIINNGVLEALGEGVVTVIDGRNTRSDYFDREPGDVLTVIDSSLHVLADGRSFDIRTRRPIGDIGSAD